MEPRTVFVTGATTPLGGAVLARLLHANASLAAYVLVAEPQAWRTAASRLPLDPQRVRAVLGSVERPRLGLDDSLWARLTDGVEMVLHLGGSEDLSLGIDALREANVEGTRRVLNAARAWGARRLVHLSTAYVAGRRVGRILESESCEAGAWVNPYERSRCEAEGVVRESGLSWIMLRPSAIVCDSLSGKVSRPTAVHRALRAYYHGLAGMLPGFEHTPVDVVPMDYVARASAALALRTSVERQAFHLCAGDGAMPLAELVDLTFSIWATRPSWARDAIFRPMLADLETYRRFELAVEERGIPRLRQMTRSLSRVLPQLAYPKTFDTTNADAVLGFRAPSVRIFWPRMIEQLVGSGWSMPRGPRAARERNGGGQRAVFAP